MNFVRLRHGKCMPTPALPPLGCLTHCPDPRWTITQPGVANLVGADHDVARACSTAKNSSSALSTVYAPQA